jgi:predicted CoA-binding protein
MFDRLELERLLAEAGDPDNPGPEELRDIVRATFVIAVVGISRDPLKAARRVPSYLAANGADIIPVNPNATRIFGRPVRASLDDVGETLDMVLLFRPSAEVGPFVLQAARRPEKPFIWLQEGIRDDEAATEARASGSTVVQGLCIFRVHRALGDTMSRARRREQSRSRAREG